jgi:hypothetical protein
MSHADLTQADHDLLVRIARENAFKAVSAAIGAVLNYSDLVRQDAERRLGVPAGDISVSDDEAYRKILDVYVDLGDAKRKLGEVA